MAKMKTMSLRLPDDIAGEIATIAAAECRTLTQQIEYALRRFAAAYREQGPVIVGVEPEPMPTGMSEPLPWKGRRKAPQAPES